MKKRASSWGGFGEFLAENPTVLQSRSFRDPQFFSKKKTRTHPVPGWLRWGHPKKYKRKGLD